MLLKYINEYRDAIFVSLIIINIFAFCLCAYDKSAARAKKHRVPERTLLSVTVLFGSFGMLSAMYLFRHKTRKPKFFITVPLCLVIQTAAVYLIMR